MNREDSKKANTNPQLEEDTAVMIFPSYDKIQNHELFSIALRAKTTEYTHGLHRFPAKFVPQIPRWAFREFLTEGGIALDPFMGSGTSLVEGLISKGSIFGVDIDPLARLIAKAKISLPLSQRVATLTKRILHHVESTPCPTLIPPMPDIRNFSHWFSEDNWSAIQTALPFVLRMHASEEERLFLLVLLSSTLRWVSRADDQSQKTYVSGTRTKTVPAFSNVFQRFSERAISGLQSLHLDRRKDCQAVVLDNSTASSIALPDNSVQLIVTSPPYLDSVDYMYNFMLEYFWLGPFLGVENRRAFNLLRRKPIGSKRPENSRSLPESLSDLIVENNISEHRRQASLAYLANMEDHFREAARVLKDNGTYVLVIGNSRTKNETLCVHDCLVRLAFQHRIRIEKAFAYRIRRHYMKFPRKGRGGIILVDWVIVMKKIKRKSRNMPLQLPMITASLGESGVAC